MDVQLVASGLKVNIAEWLHAIDLQVWEFDEDAAIACEALEIGVALPIQVGAHLFNLEIGHVADAPAQGALVGAGTTELETLDQSSLRQQLTRGADNLAEADITGKNGHNVGTAGDPNNRFVFLSLKPTAGVNLEEFRVHRSLKKAESKLINCDFNLWHFHDENPRNTPFST